MTRFRGLLATCALVALVIPVTWAQYPSPVVGFNGPPIDDPATCQEMFRIPQWSGTTAGYVIPNTGSAFDYNGAYRASGLQTEGAAAMQVYFNWVDPADPNAWVRLTTFDGPAIPNPALHTQGKVRFKITNRSELFAGTVGLCIGIRETGASVGQMENGGTTGTIEWVGVSNTPNGITVGPDHIVDTAANPASDDVQVVPVGSNLDVLGLPLGTAVVDPGPNGVLQTTPANDDEIRRGYFLNDAGGRVPIPAITLAPSVVPYTVEFNLATGSVKVNSTTYPGTIAGFTGNGILDAANDRGVLEHIAFTNVTTDTAILIDAAVDELQFEATIPDPLGPPSIRGPVVSTDTQVIVDCIPEATAAELFKNGLSAGVVTPVAGVATFGGLSLQVGDILTATQTAYGTTSPLSPPVIVYAPGTALADGFDTYDGQAELEQIWAQTDPSNARKPLLTSGNASSCDNLVVENYASGAAVSRLYYYLGSVNGTDAQPLWVTFRFKHNVNNGNARARFELTPSLSRVYGALGFAFSNGIGGLWSTQYTTMTNSPDPVINGYASDYFGYDYALTGIDRVPGVWHKMQIQVKSSVVNFYIDDVLANPVDTSGTPLWPAGVPRVNNDAFQYIVIGVGNSNNGPAMMYDDVSVMLGNATPPFGPPNPVPSPTVVGPLFPADVQVELSSLDETATAAAVFADGAQIGSATGPFPGGTAIVNVTALLDGNVVTATQTVSGIESCYSAPVTVAVPAPALVAPLVPTQTQVGVSGIAENVASAVTVYREIGGGQYVQLGTLGSPTTDPAVVTTIALTDGDAIVATQTIGGVEGPASAAVTVAVPAPVLVGPLDVNDTEAPVTGVHPLAGLVTAYVNGTPYSIDPQGQPSVSVTVPPLQPSDLVFATQTIGGVESPQSNGIVVANYITVNEFNYDDPGTDDYAFIELYNSSADPVNVSGWKLQTGDYIAPGIYWEYIFPAGTTIPGHGYWTVGMTAVAALPGAVVNVIDDGLRMDDGQNYAALRTPGDVLLDAVGWEMNKGYTFVPGDIHTQLGTGIWGNHVNAENPLTSQSRFLDGLDTDNNGRDFGIQKATPGYSNNQPDLTPYLQNADSLTPLSNVPDWVFSYVPLRAVDPTVADPTLVNPAAIPASPQGGLAMIGWDESGGGNAMYLSQYACENFQLETYIYVPPVLTPNGYEETKIGLRGSADGVHNFDWYNGATGLCWIFQRGTTWQTLYLLDENDGNDGSPSTPLCATILGQVTIGTEPSLTGWQRLLLETRGDHVLGIFGGTYGSMSDGVQILATHDSPGPGGVYVTYRENMTGTGVPDNRPPTMDAFSLKTFPNVSGDMDEDGDVDLADFALFQDCAGQTGLTYPCTLGDFYGDDNITASDLFWLAAMLNGPLP